MNLRMTAALAIAVLSLASANLAAQTAESFLDPVAGISLDQAIARALAQEPSLRATRTTIDVARGAQLQAGLRKNPSLSTELRREPSGTDSQTMVSVEWPLDLFRRDGRVAVASREVASAEYAFADRERLFTAEVRTRFGEALVEVRELAVLDELVEASRRQLDVLHARVEAGASPPLERDLVDVELRRLNADRVLQLGRVERAMHELKRWLGVPPMEPLHLRDSLEDVVRRDADLTHLLAEREPRRPDMQDAEARVAIADAKIERAQRDGRVDVTIFAGYMRMENSFAQFGLSPAGAPERVHGRFSFVTGGATVTLPMLNRNSGEIAAARAERLGAMAMRAATELSVSAEVAAARALDQRTHEAVSMYAGDVRDLARRNLSVVRQSYELGRTTILEVLAEQRRYLDLERAYSESLRAAYEARTALTRAMGETR